MHPCAVCVQAEGLPANPPRGHETPRTAREARTCDLDRSDAADPQYTAFIDAEQPHDLEAETSLTAAGYSSAALGASGSGSGVAMGESRATTPEQSHLQDPQAAQDPAQAQLRPHEGSPGAATRQPAARLRPDAAHHLHLGGWRVGSGSLMGLEGRLWQR